nr:hypothetical protein [Arsenophonus endosymbiont of Aleurodicus floccissimus]
MKTDANRDIATRLAQVEKTVTRTPEAVLPALVLAAKWYDNAARETDITSRNAVNHPGFMPVKPLRIPAKMNNYVILRVNEREWGAGRGYKF